VAWGAGRNKGRGGRVKGGLHLLKRELEFERGA